MTIRKRHRLLNAPWYRMCGGVQNRCALPGMATYGYPVLSHRTDPPLSLCITPVPVIFQTPVKTCEDSHTSFAPVPRQPASSFFVCKSVQVSVRHI